MNKKIKIRHFLSSGYLILEKVTRFCEQLGLVSAYLRPKCIKFCIRNLENDREDKNGQILLLFLIMKNKFLIEFAKIELFKIFQTKSCLFASVFILSTISQILDTNMYKLILLDSTQVYSIIEVTSSKQYLVITLISTRVLKG